MDGWRVLDKKPGMGLSASGRDDVRAAARENARAQRVGHDQDFDVAKTARAAWGVQLGRLRTGWQALTAGRRRTRSVVAVWGAGPLYHVM
jgi:hypothetical protein